MRWRIDALRERSHAWRRERQVRRIKRQARTVIQELVTMKAANPGRPFCGILLIEHIGDIVACEPIIAQVRASHPRAFIVWLVKPQFAPLLASHPDLSAIVHVDSLLIVEAIVDARVFDHVVDLHVNSKPTDVPGRAYRKTSGNPAIDTDNYLGEGSLLRAFSLAAGIEPNSAAPTLYVPTEAVAGIDARRLPKEFLVIHAAAGTTGEKNWSRRKWRELVSYIVDHYDTRVIEIGLEPVIGFEHSRFSSLCGQLSLMETAELIRRSTFFLGVDSGPAHMANAWRRPALLLFGHYRGSDTFNPFDGYYGGEWAESVILRYPGSLSEQPTDSVIRALEASALWNEAFG
jgi:heptosyltransferase-3